MLILKDELNIMINEDVMMYVAQGYTIENMSTMMAGIISADLVRGKDKVTMKVVFVSNEDVSFTKCSVYENEDLVKELILYGLGVNAYTTSIDEYKEARQKMIARYNATRKNTQFEIPVTRQNVKFIRGIKGWKTVARKNLRLVRYGSDYILQNKVNGHEQSISLLA